MLFLLFAALPTRAVTVSALHAEHRHGQTFLTWSAPPGTGWRYRVYRSVSPIVDVATLNASSLAGSVGDSTWADRRFSQLRGQTFAYSIDSLAAPLTASQGLCVITPASDRLSFYAVTAQLGANAEDRTVLPGVNALAVPVTEFVARTRPVYQRTVPQGVNTFDLYTTWAHPEDTPLEPAMTTGHGHAFDHAVVRGTPGGPLHMRPHARGGSLLNGLGSSGEPGEWRVSLDDPLYASSDRNSFWYGYHEGYDLDDPTPLVPIAGQVRPFTRNRVLHTFAWARRELAVDTTRAIASGGSMGAIGSLRLAFGAPQWLAGIHLIVPKFDFSFTTDPNPANAWNAGSPERVVGDHLWGTIATGLLAEGGEPVYGELNDGVLAARNAAVSLPPMLAFNGRNDTVVGWAEKLGFYAAMQTHRHGGTFYFDQRRHDGSGAVWAPQQNVRNLYRYRTDRSYPALTNADCDDDPGNGSLASGDTLGTINGHLDWDTSLTDELDGWGCVLRTRDLASTSGTVPGPDSARVDVTPRRLQRFAPIPGESLVWQVRRLADDAMIQSGQVLVESDGRVTVPAVRVLRAGVRLSLLRATALDVGEPPAVRPFSARAFANPARSALRFQVDAPPGTMIRASLHDLAGREVRPASSLVGSGGLVWSAAGLPPGVYLARFVSGRFAAVERVIVLP